MMCTTSLVSRTKYFNAAFSRSVSISGTSSLNRQYRSPLCTCPGQSLLKSSFEMDGDFVSEEISIKQRYVHTKEVYHGTLECFSYMFLCHLSSFQLLQLHIKLHNIEMSCLAHDFGMFGGLKQTDRLFVYTTQSINASFTYYLRNQLQ